eukprot:6285308-Prymnesium_polylepis.1
MALGRPRTKVRSRSRQAILQSPLRVASSELGCDARSAPILAVDRLPKPQRDGCRLAIEECATDGPPGLQRSSHCGTHHWPSARVVEYCQGWPRVLRDGKSFRQELISGFSLVVIRDEFAVALACLLARQSTLRVAKLGRCQRVEGLGEVAHPSLGFEETKGIVNLVRGLVRVCVARVR